MTIDLKKYQTILTKIDELQKEASRAEGVLTELRKQLQSEFNCSTVREAKTLLAKLQHEHQQAETKFNALMDDFEKEYGDLLT